MPGLVGKPTGPRGNDGGRPAKPEHKCRFALMRRPSAADVGPVRFSSTVGWAPNRGARSFGRTSARAAHGRGARKIVERTCNWGDR